ncbi:guanine nucleotide binding protein, alpha subunit [Flagelloscypha sp. PMI_526]|nr:guanine nucleotide binding protein, alpha subunit [Flagelloscypha sp. PMI_526]
MFNTPSRKTNVPNDSDHAARVSLDIEESLEKDRSLARRDIHFLIMGIAGSGKSIILNQFGTPLPQDAIEYTIAERDSYREVIFSDMFSAMRTILEELGELELTLAAANEQHASTILEFDPSAGFSRAGLPLHISEALGKVYADSTVKTVLSRSKKLETVLQSMYFFEELDRIASPRYLPSDEDINHCSTATGGVTKYQRTVGQLNYIIWDVDGQRGQRRKWMNCFETITATIFVVPVSSYDEKNPSGPNNAIEQSVTLFDEVCNSTWLKDTPIILLFNDIAPFSDKPSSTPLSHDIISFSGGSDFHNKLVERFATLNPNPQREVYVHWIEPDGGDLKGKETVTKFILDCAKDIILQQAMRSQKLISGNKSKGVFNFFKSQ